MEICGRSLLHFEMVYLLLEHRDGLGDLLEELSSPAWGQICPRPSQLSLPKIKAIKLPGEPPVCSRLPGSLVKILELCCSPPGMSDSVIVVSEHLIEEGVPEVCVAAELRRPGRHCWGKPAAGGAGDRRKGLGTFM